VSLRSIARAGALAGAAVAVGVWSSGGRGRALDERLFRAANAGGWFSESMFVRFLPLVVQGCWRGRSYG